MKSFVSITICILSIANLCWSQHAAIHQPKSIRNGALYHQEIFYGGSNSHGAPNSQPPAVLIQKSIPEQQPQPVRPLLNIPVPVTIPQEVVRQVPIPLVRQPPQPVTTTTTTVRPRTTTEPLTSEEEEEQSKSAYYNFGTSVQDTINDHSHQRQEVRDGLKLKGMYSYSDGFFKRTVHYEADEGGYRVVKEEVVPLSPEGPKFHPKGHADVKSTLTGDYSITIDDFKLNKQQQEVLNKGAVN